MLDLSGPFAKLTKLGFNEEEVTKGVLKMSSMKVEVIMEYLVKHHSSSIIGNIIHISILGFLLF